jgi:hypothetical protein
VVNASSKFAVFLSPHKRTLKNIQVGKCKCNKLALEKRRLKIENKRVNYLYCNSSRIQGITLK